MLTLLVASSGRVTAQPVEISSQPLIITEILTGTAVSASQEFIEIHNISTEPVDLTGWRVQYLSAANTDWTKATRTIELSGVVNADGYILIASNDYLPEAVFHYTSTLAQSGGHVRVINANDTTQFDLLGWGTAAAPRIAAATAAPVDQSMMRAQDQFSQYLMNGNNRHDFILSTTPTPGNENSVPLPEEEVEVESESETANEAEVTANEAEVTANEDLEPINWPDIRITELLPNPASPALDSEAEFVELFNASNVSVDLSGYIIKTGSKLTYKYSIDTQSIGPGEYLALTSAQTNLTLSNTAGKAVLYAPDETVLSETAPYEKAANGQSWILNGDAWAWTTVPTQGSENILTAPVLGLSLSLPKTKAATAKKSTKKPAAKKTTSKKTKTTKPKLSTQKDSEDAAAVAATSSQKPTRPMHPLVLAGIGAVVVLYALYEYRHDMANRVRQFRTNRAARRALGSSSEVAGSN